MQKENPALSYENYANVIAPAAAGCALGILFGRGMRRGSSNVIALTLLAASAVVAVFPSVSPAKIAASRATPIAGFASR